jgi:hypothetical protein
MSPPKALANERSEIIFNALQVFSNSVFVGSPVLAIGKESAYYAA